MHSLDKILTINLASALKTIVMFCVLLGFGSVPSLFNVKGIDALTLGCIVLLMVVNKAYFMNLKIFLVIACVVLVSLLNMLITGSSISEYYSVFGRLIAMALLITAFKNNYEDITSHFAKALGGVVVLAIINFILYMIFKGLYTPVQSHHGFPTNTIGYLFNYYSSFQLSGIAIPRNQGMFWEPGVLQIPVNILIYYQLIEQKKSIKSVLLPIFIIFTTMSTTGFMILGTILLFKFKTLFSLRGKGLLRTIGMIMIMMAFTPFIYMQIYTKFNTPGENISSIARTYDLVMSAKIASDYPLTGIGINPDRNKALMKVQTVEIDGYSPESRGNTNTILQMFVNFGVPITLLLLIALYRQRLFKYKLGFFIVITLALFSEPLMGVFLLILLMISSVNVMPSSSTTSPEN